MSPTFDPLTQPDVLGLPTTGAMGTEPAVTVSRLMALASLGVALAAKYLGYELPPDVRAFADTWGIPLAGIVIAAWQLLQGRLIRNRVVAPSTALALVQRALGTKIVPESAVSALRLHSWR